MAPTVNGKRLNICISSSINWNPGDEFIRYGVRYLLDALLGPGHNYFIWNRNPDFFNQAWADDRIKETFLSNSCYRADLAYMDLFVFAGTPEWFGGPTEPLYREILRRNVPAVFLGMGSGRDLQFLNETEKQVLNAERTFFSTRSDTLASELELQGVKNVYTLPCPAVLCVEPVKYARRKKTGKIGFLLQTTSASCQNSNISFAEEFFKLPQNPHYELLASYIAETREAFTRGYKAHFSFEPRDYFAVYSEYDWLITTRLHGALSALSAGIPAVLVTDPGNRRIQTASALYREILPTENSLSAALDRIALPQYTAGYEAHRRKIFNFKYSVFEMYRRELEQFFRKNFSG